MKKTKKVAKKSVKKTAPSARVKKAETILPSAVKFKSLISEHDARSLTSHERLYDNEILRNNLNTVKTREVAMQSLNLNLKYKNTEPNKRIVRDALKKMNIKKGDVVTFASRNSDTKSGNFEKLVTFVVSNRLSALKKIDCEDTFIFLVK